MALLLAHFSTPSQISLVGYHHLDGVIHSGIPSEHQLCILQTLASCGLCSSFWPGLSTVQGLPLGASDNHVSSYSQFQIILFGCVVSARRLHHI